VCTGLYILTDDDLTAEEVSDRLPFAQFKELAAEGLALLTKSSPPRVTAPRRVGRKGQDDFLRR